MPAMQLRRADDVIQNTESQIDIRMLKESIDGIKDKIQGEHFCTDAHDNKGKRIKQKLNGLLEGMKTPSIEPVQLVLLIMNRLQAP